MLQHAFTDLSSCSYLCCILTRRSPALLPQLRRGNNKSLLELDLPTYTVTIVAPQFDDVLITRVLGPELASVIAQHRKALMFSTLAANEDDNSDSASEDSTAIILETRLNCWHTLLLLLCEPDISPWQEATATALYAMDQPIASNLGSSSACFQMLGRRILDALDKVEIYQEHASLHRLRLWLLVVAAHLLTTGRQCADIVVNRFAQFCSLLCLRTVEDLKMLLQGFFDHIPGFDRTIAMLWLSFA